MVGREVVMIVLLVSGRFASGRLGTFCARMDVDGVDADMEWVQMAA
jgi:hypothetical protein